MKILVINGPNINMLGIREPDIYGKNTYADLCELINDYAKKLGVEVEIYQSNHEGDLVDEIQAAYGIFDGIVINPGAYTHTSIAILDALKAVNIPAVEVHISDVDSREEFRKISYVRKACFETISGKGTDGYLLAIDALIKKQNLGQANQPKINITLGNSEPFPSSPNAMAGYSMANASSDSPDKEKDKHWAENP